MDLSKPQHLRPVQLFVVVLLALFAAITGAGGGAPDFDLDVDPGATPCPSGCRAVFEHALQRSMGTQGPPPCCFLSLHDHHLQLLFSPCPGLSKELLQKHAKEGVVMLMVVDRLLLRVGCVHAGSHRFFFSTAPLSHQTLQWVSCLPSALSLPVKFIDTNTSWPSYPCATLFTHTCSALGNPGCATCRRQTSPIGEG